MIAPVYLAMSHYHFQHSSTTHAATTAIILGTASDLPALTRCGRDGMPFVQSCAKEEIVRRRQAWRGPPSEVRQEVYAVRPNDERLGEGPLTREEGLLGVGEVRDHSSEWRARRRDP